MSHTHRWIAYYEEFLFGGSFVAGYKCADCGAWVAQGDLPATGLAGLILDEIRLVGPHGGRGRCTDGSAYKEQIYNDGKLEIIR